MTLVYHHKTDAESTINFVIEDGFVTLGGDDFIISELEGKFLREGRYIRLNGDIESSIQVLIHQLASLVD